MHQSRLIPIWSVALAAASGTAQAKDAIVAPQMRNADRYFTRAAEFGLSGTAMVIRDGKVILHKGYGLADRDTATPVTTRTLFDIASLSKQFTFAAIQSLISDGKLKLDTRLADCFDNVPDDKKDITIAMLIDHRAGLPWDAGSLANTRTRDEAVAVIMGLPLRGTYYSNVGYTLLAAIVEKVSGISFRQFVKDRILKPAGMTRTWFAGDEELKVADVAVAEVYGERALTHTQLSSWNGLGAMFMFSCPSDLTKWRAYVDARATLSDEIRSRGIGRGANYWAFEALLSSSPGETRAITVNERGGTSIFTEIITANLNGKKIEPLPRVKQLKVDAMRKLLGVYQISPGQLFHISSRGGRIQIGGEGNTAIAALHHRHSAMDAEADLMKSILEAQSKGDYTLFREHCPEDVDRAWENEMRATWSEDTKTHGPLKKAEYLGNSENQTFARLIFADGSTHFQRYVWSGRSIVEFGRPTEYPSTRIFAASGDRELLSADRATHLSSGGRASMGLDYVRLTVVGEKNGRVDQIRLSSSTGNEVVATRVEDAPK